MNMIEKIITVIAFSLLAVVYGVWYVNNSRAVKACMDNLPACERAYYGE